MPGPPPDTSTARSPSEAPAADAPSADPSRRTSSANDSTSVRYSQLLTDLGDILTLAQRHVRLTQQSNDLLRTVPLLHKESFPALRAERILSHRPDQFSERGSHQCYLSSMSKVTPSNRTLVSASSRFSFNLIRISNRPGSNCTNSRKSTRHSLLRPAAILSHPIPPGPKIDCLPIRFVPLVVYGISVLLSRSIISTRQSGRYPRSNK